MNKPAVSLVAVIVAVVALVLGIVGISLSNQQSTGLQEVVFTHAEMTPDQITLVKAGPEENNLGDTRYYVVPATSPEGGIFTGTLTVMALDTPAAGQQIRESNLVFQFGAIEDQIVVQGVASYDAASPALKPGDVVVRPITGGSGKFAGASGWVETTHNADGSWEHVFRYTTVLE